MTQKRNSRSSVISMEEENIDLLDFDADKDEDGADYIETDLGTDNIEDIIFNYHVFWCTVYYYFTYIFIFNFR